MSSSCVPNSATREHPPVDTLLAYLRELEQRGPQGGPHARPRDHGTGRTPGPPEVLLMTRFAIIVTFEADEADEAIALRATIETMLAACSWCP